MQLVSQRFGFQMSDRRTHMTKKWRLSNESGLRNTTRTKTSHSEQASWKELVGLPEITLSVSLTSQGAHEGEYTSLEDLMSTKGSMSEIKPNDSEVMNALELFHFCDH